MPTSHEGLDVPIERAPVRAEGGPELGKPDPLDSVGRVPHQAKGGSQSRHWHRPVALYLAHPREDALRHRFV